MKNNRTITPKVRILVFQGTNGKCEKCKNPARHIHHKDKNRLNNSMDNLQALCISCHYTMHAKSKRIYGVPKIGIEVTDELKLEFSIKCVEIGKSKNYIITELIKNWLHVSKWKPKKL